MIGCPAEPPESRRQSHHSHGTLKSFIQAEHGWLCDIFVVRENLVPLFSGLSDCSAVEHFCQLWAQSGLVLRRSFRGNVSCKVELTPLPGKSREYSADCGDNPSMRVRDNHPRICQPPLSQSWQKIGPCLSGFIGICFKSNDFPKSFAVDGKGNHKRPGRHPVVLPHLKVRGINSEEWVGICQRTVPEFIHVSIQAFADLRNSWFRKWRSAQLFRYTGDLPGGNTFQNHGCHGREKGLFTARIVFKEHRPEWLIPVSGYAQS